MVFHSSNRILFLGFTVFVAIAVYVLVATHHLRLPEGEQTVRSHRDKLSVEALHHSLLEDFSKYDADRDSKLSIHEFATLLRENRHRAKEQAASDALVALSGQTRGDDGDTYGDVGEDGSTGEDDPAQERLGQVEGEGDDDESAEGGGDNKAEDEDGGGDSAEEKKGDYEKDDAAAAVGAADAEGAKHAGQGDQAAGANAAEGGAAAGAVAGAGADNAAVVAQGQAAVAVAPAAAAAAAAGGGCPELSREHVAQFARQGTVMLTVADWRIFGTMGINWMKHLAKYGVDYYLVGATDAKTAEFLGHTGKHPCFKFYEDGAHHGSDEYKYGDSHYNAATWRKVVVVSRMVNWGFNVIHSDVDVVWFRDPLPYFLGKELEGVDMAVSSDLISTQNKPGDEGLEVGMAQHTNFNTGVYFVRSSPGGKSFMAGWAAMRRTHSNENDQVGVYHFVRNRPGPLQGRALVLQPREGEAAAAASFAADPAAWEAPGPAPHAALPVGSEMRLGSLGVHMLLNGYSYFIPKLHERMGVKPLGVHMTWVPLSKEGKFHRFRDGMLYDDPPEYYDAPGLKFLTADIDAPDAPEGFNTWRETEDMVQVHLRSMPPQLKQMYRAAAAAVVLGRTLIFPRLRCFCFKNWFMSEQCRIPGDRVTQFPLDCALDQVFRPKVLYNYPPLNTGSGPVNFTFREYSFLDNPRTPGAVREGQVLVVPEGADPGPTAGFQQVVRVGPRLQSNELAAALAAVKDARVLRLRHVMDLFGGFSDPVLKASFEEFAHAITANWCCRDEPYIKKGLPKKVKMVMEW